VENTNDLPETSQPSCYLLHPSGAPERPWPWPFSKPDHLQFHFGAKVEAGWEYQLEKSQGKARTPS